MSKNLIGNAPNQVPTNADLGEMAYQDTYWVRVGNITVDYHTTITGNTTVVGNLILSNATSNVLLSGGAGIVITTGNIQTSGNIIMTTGNINTAGNIIITNGNINTSGNINVNTGNISTSSNINVTGTGNISVQSLIIAQGNIFCNTATLSGEANSVITRGYLDSQLVIFGF